MQWQVCAQTRTCPSQWRVYLLSHSVSAATRSIHSLNYDHEREEQEQDVLAIYMMHKSCEWFEAELTLQQIFENETAKPST